MNYSSLRSFKFCIDISYAHLCNRYSQKDTAVYEVKLWCSTTYCHEIMLLGKSLQWGRRNALNVQQPDISYITIKFQVPPTCEIPWLIANLVSNLGMKIQEQSGASDMVIRAWDSTIAWHQEQKNEDDQRDKFSDEGDLSEIEVIKQGTFSPTELDTLVSLLRLAGEKPGQGRSIERKSRGDSAGLPSNKSTSSLEAMGASVFGHDGPPQGRRNGEISWDTIAGYDQQKREIEDTILLALRCPEVYVLLLVGLAANLSQIDLELCFLKLHQMIMFLSSVSGTGKTSCARVIATQVGSPLLYVPLEVVMSKCYGESERLLGKVFPLPKSSQMVDSFAIARDSEMHEATRRILCVLLRQIDGFEQDRKVVVIAATNREQDLSFYFFRREAQYAKHLSKPELVTFASATEGFSMSVRDIRDVCQQAERRWASKIVRGQALDDANEGSLPPLIEYIGSVESRSKSLLAVEELKNQSSNLATDKRPLDFS
ncbi:hypothetical protein Ancab_033430 [Ancistrocladus abbreviatus]